MSSIAWESGVSGDWTTASDWVGGVAPGAGDDVTISAAGTYTVTIDSPDAASSLLLNDPGATIVDTGMLTMGGTLALHSGALQLGAGGSIIGGVLDDTNGVIQCNGGTLSNVTFIGSLDMSAANSELYLNGDMNFQRNQQMYLTGAGAALYDSGGTIAAYYFRIGSSTSDTLAIYDPYGAGVTLILKAALTQVGANALVTDIGNGDDTLVNDDTVYVGFSGGTLTIDNRYFVNNGDVQVYNQNATFILNSQSFTNSGYLIVAESGTVSDINSASVTNTNKYTDGGSMEAYDGGTLDLTHATLTNIEGARLVGGQYTVGDNYQTTGGTIDLPENEAIADLGAIVTIYGNNGIIQSLNTSSNTYIDIESTLDEILKTGTLQLENGCDWTSSSKFFNAGKFVLGEGAFVAPQLRNIGSVSGDGVIVGKIINAGTITATSIVNAGTIGSELDLKGPVLGSGLLEIENGGTLSLAGSVGSKINLLFSPSGAEVLALRDLSRFSATINGFGLGSGSDSIDLVGTKATSAKLEAGDKLVVSDHATVVATLQLAGDYLGYGFGVTSDKSGGVYVYIANRPAAVPPAAPHHMAAAMAGLGADAGAATVMASGPDPRLEGLMISPPRSAHVSAP